MNRAWMLLAVLACSASASREVHMAHISAAQQRPTENFKSWVEQHAKSYANDAVEYGHRMSIWLENLAYIASYNAKTDTHWLGLNALADLTPEEYRRHYLGYNHAARKPRVQQGAYR